MITITINTHKVRITHHQIDSELFAGGNFVVVGGGLIVVDTVMLVHSDQLITELRMCRN